LLGECEGQEEDKCSEKKGGPDHARHGGSPFLCGGSNRTMGDVERGEKDACPERQDARKSERRNEQP
jgi:hypothetical protein